MLASLKWLTKRGRRDFYCDGGANVWKTQLSKRARSGAQRARSEFLNTDARTIVLNFFCVHQSQCRHLQ